MHRVWHKNDVALNNKCITFITFLTMNYLFFSVKENQVPGPSCSKLTMSLVNDMLKFTWSDTQIC